MLCQKGFDPTFVYAILKLTAHQFVQNDSEENFSKEKYIEVEKLLIPYILHGPNFILFGN